MKPTEQDKGIIMALLRNELRMNRQFLRQDRSDEASVVKTRKAIAIACERYIRLLEGKDKVLP